MTHMTKMLTSPLSAERLNGLPAWLGEEALRSLESPADYPTGAFVAAGRVLRASAGASEDRASLRRWLGEGLRGVLLQALVQRALDTSSEAAEALYGFCMSSEDARATLAIELGHESADWGEVPAGGTIDIECARSAVQDRDDLESAAWALGAARRACSMEAEQSDSRVEEDLRLGVLRVNEAAAGVDMLGSALRTQVMHALAEIDDQSWLSVIAGLEEGWWCDAFRPLARLAKSLDIDALVTDATAEPIRDNLVVLFPLREQLDQPMAMAAADGASAMDLALEQEPGVELGRALGDRVRVYGVGLGDEADMTPGLVVRAGEAGDFGDLSSVKLEPEGPASTVRDEIAEAWWVPLAGCGGALRSIVITLGSGEKARVELKPSPPAPAPG